MTSCHPLREALDGGIRYLLTAHDVREQREVHTREIGLSYIVVGFHAQITHAALAFVYAAFADARRPPAAGTQLSDHCGCAATLSSALVILHSPREHSRVAAGAVLGKSIFDPYQTASSVFRYGLAASTSDTLEDFGKVRKSAAHTVPLLRHQNRAPPKV